MPDLVTELRRWASVFAHEAELRVGAPDQFSTGEYAAYREAARQLAERADGLEEPAGQAPGVGWPAFQTPEEDA